MLHHVRDCSLLQRGLAHFKNILLLTSATLSSYVLKQYQPKLKISYTKEPYYRLKMLPLPTRRATNNHCPASGCNMLSFLKVILTEMQLGASRICTLIWWILVRHVEEHWFNEIWRTFLNWDGAAKTFETKGMMSYENILIGQIPPRILHHTIRFLAHTPTSARHIVFHASVWSPVP